MASSIHLPTSSHTGLLGKQQFLPSSSSLPQDPGSLIAQARTCLRDSGQGHSVLLPEGSLFLLELPSLGIFSLYPGPWRTASSPWGLHLWLKQFLSEILIFLSHEELCLINRHVREKSPSLEGGSLTEAPLWYNLKTWDKLALCRSAWKRVKFFPQHAPSRTHQAAAASRHTCSCCGIFFPSVLAGSSDTNCVHLVHLRISLGHQILSNSSKSCVTELLAPSTRRPTFLKITAPGNRSATES